MTALAPQRPLRICMLSDDFVPAATGVGSHLQTVAALLAARGHHVDVVTTRRPGEPAEEDWRGVHVHRMPSLRVFGFWQALPSARRLETLFQALRPDVVHQHYLGVMFLRALRAAKKLGLPQVYTYHMTEDHLTQPLPLRPFRRLVAAEIRRRCNEFDRVISVSSNLAQRLRDSGMRPPVQTISNPVAFDADATGATAARDAAFCVLFAGRLNPEKNVPYLLRAFARFVAAHGDAVLWLAGDGSQRGALEALAAELGLGARVRFLGFVQRSDLTAYYRGCDVFVLPSHVETQGLVAMEAMWFGKPVLVADTVVSAPELVEPGRNGYIVDAGDVGDLTRRLQELAADPSLRAAMGDAGRRMAEQFQPEPIVDALDATYREVTR